MSHDVSSQGNCAALYWRHLVGFFLMPHQIGSHTGDELICYSRINTLERLGESRVRFRWADHENVKVTPNSRGECNIIVKIFCTYFFPGGGGGGVLCGILFLSFARACLSRVRAKGSTPLCVSLWISMRGLSRPGAAFGFYANLICPPCSGLEAAAIFRVIW